jgi:hypothetical protein
VAEVGGIERQAVDRCWHLSATSSVDQLGEGAGPATDKDDGASSMFASLGTQLFVDVMFEPDTASRCE